MNKKIIALMIFTMSMLIGYAQKAQKYIIAGEIQGMDSGWVWMKQKAEEGNRLLDSSRIERGKFGFKGKLSQGIQSVNLYFNKERGSLVVFLEPGKIRIGVKKDSIYYGRVTGTPNNELWGNYLREDIRLESEETRLSKLYQESFKTKDRNKVKAAEKMFSDGMADRKVLKANFLAAPENKYVAMCWYRVNLIHRMQFNELDSIMNAFGNGLEQNNDYCLIVARRELVRTQAVGQKFGEINLPDQNGEMKSLSDLKGKWVLVDFWASWCGPCRKEGQHVLELYKRYHQEGFEVFGISIDQNTDYWKKAILEDQTNWIHVCDKDSKIAREFGITVVPHLFLLNPEGKITNVNIRGEQLTRKLEAVFQK